MLRNRLLLGLVAFGISFGMNLAASRDARTSLAAGLTTLPAAIVAAMIVEGKQKRQADARISALKKHIRVLQKRWAEANHAYAQLAAEREQLAVDFDLEETPAIAAFRLPPAPAPAPRKSISWDLSVPISQGAVVEVKPYELPTEIRSLPESDVSEKRDLKVEAELNQLLADAAAAKRKIEANLKSLQAELSRLQTQVANQRQTKDKLLQEVTDLRQQKQRLETESVTARKDVDNLKRCQKEIDQYLTEAETKKKDLEKGNHPLQAALKQLQSQISTHQEELRRLEIQVSDRRQQKEQLEQQVALLNSSQQTFSDRPVQSPRPPVQKNGSAHPSSASSNGSNKVISTKAASSSPEIVSAPVSQSPAKSSSTTLEPPKPEKPADPSDGWDELMGQLPEYEFQVLRAIVEQNNPAALVKKIAEENLTMPEMLIDSINERALDTVGDIIIEPGTGAGSATIVREHLRTVKKMLKTYGVSGE